jgi:hypothetical protein
MICVIVVQKRVTVFKSYEQMFTNCHASTVSHDIYSRSHRLASAARQGYGFSPKRIPSINTQYLNTSLTLRIHSSTTMNPFVDSNIFLRMAQDMEDEDHELEVATYQHRRRLALNERRYAGSIPGRVRIHRDHTSGDVRIRADYFCAQPVYTDAQFRRRYVFCYAHLFTSILRTSHLY